MMKPIRTHPARRAWRVLLLGGLCLCPFFAGRARACIPPPPPAAPTGLAATSISTSQINLSWNDVTGETGYKIERSPNGSNNWDQIATVGADVTSYPNTSGLSAGTQYWYRVRAYNGGGNSNYSNVANTWTRPNAPAITQVQAASASSLHIVWGAVTSATSYKVYRDTSSGGSFTNQVGTPSGTSFDDTGLTAGTQYYYKVVAVNAGGDSDKSAAGNNWTRPSPPSLSPLSALSVSSLRVTWGTVTSATSYKVYRDTASNGTFTNQVGTPSGTSFDDTGLSAGTTYWYKVVAVNGGGDSDKSAAASGLTLPAAPTISQVQAASASSLHVVWGAVASATSYKVYRDTASGGAFTNLVGSPSTAAFDDSGLSAGTTYWYKVVAVNASGDSAKSSAASGPTLPVAPAAPSVQSISSTVLQVNWSAVGSATSYKVYRDTSSGGAFTNQVGSPSGTTLDDTSLSPGTQYYYKVVAVNAGGDSAKSAAGNNWTRPGVPTISQIQASSPLALHVVWGTVASATSYKLYRSNNQATSYTQQGGSITNTYYDDGGLAAETPYWYKLVAVNAGGDSDYSTPASGTTAPAAPTSLVVTPVSESRLDLGWQDHSSIETGFLVERSPNGTDGWTTRTITAANVTAWSDQSGLAEDTRYYYRVSALGGGGASASATGDGWTKPAAPTGLTATLDAEHSTNTVHLAWTDNSAHETEFRIEYSITDSDFLPAGTAPAGATSFTKSGLTPASRYWFRVRAYVNGRGESAASMPATIWTDLDDEWGPLGAPTIWSVQSCSASKLRIGWTGQPGVRSFKLYRRTGTTGDFTLRAEELTAVDYDDQAGLAAGTQYFYKVVACNYGGESEPSPPEGNWTRPLTPALLAVDSLSSAALRVTWQALPDATGYKLYRAIDGQTALACLGDVGVTTSCLDTSALVAGTRYAYHVSALNPGGESELSQPRTNATRPADPAIASIQALGHDALRVNWNAVTGALYGYRVYRANAEDSTYTLLGTVQNPPYEDRAGLSEATRYWYKVVAMGLGGDSGFSAPVGQVTGPVAPSDLLAVADDASSPTRCMKVQWTDHSTSETGFLLERSPNGNDDWTTAATLGPSAGVGGTVTVTDLGPLSEGRRYWYRVRARLAPGL